MTDVKDNKKWFAIYVKSRSEKKVLKLLEDIGVESFLPLITRVKQWSDRKKKVEEPLFRSYLFVNIPLSDYYTVLNVNGVVKFITFEKKPVPVPDNQIIAIKEYLNDTELHSIDYEDFKEGELVRIKSGQMKDLIGRFIKINGKHRVIIDIEAVGQSIPINIARSNVEAVK
jgi:transcription elongation factor/antiterminator RfaH